MLYGKLIQWCGLTHYKVSLEGACVRKTSQESRSEKVTHQLSCERSEGAAQPGLELVEEHGGRREQQVHRPWGEKRARLILGTDRRLTRLGFGDWRGNRTLGDAGPWGPYKDFGFGPSAAGSMEGCKLAYAFTWPWCEEWMQELADVEVKLNNPNWRGGSETSTSQRNVRKDDLLRAMDSGNQVSELNIVFHLK